MKKKTLLAKFKFKHLCLRKKGKKFLVKKKSANYVLIAKIRRKRTLWFTNKHIEIIRRIFYKRVSEEKGIILSRIFPYYPISRKPLQTRMGKGKGKVKFHVISVNNGQHLLDIFGLITNKAIRKLICKINYRLSPCIKVIHTRLYTTKYQYKDIIFRKKIKKAQKKFFLMLQGGYKFKAKFSKKLVTNAKARAKFVLPYRIMRKKYIHLKKHLKLFLSKARARKKLSKIKKTYDNNRNYYKNC